MDRRILNKNKSVVAKVFTLIFFLLLFIFILRLGYLCLSGKVDGINLKEFSNKRNTKEETLYALRGNIYDVNGNVLAQTINSYTLIATRKSYYRQQRLTTAHAISQDIYL